MKRGVNRGAPHAHHTPTIHPSHGRVPSQARRGCYLAAIAYREAEGAKDKVYISDTCVPLSRLAEGISFGRFEARVRGASRWPGVCPAWWAWREHPRLPSPAAFPLRENSFGL